MDSDEMSPLFVQSLVCLWTEILRIVYLRKISDVFEVGLIYFHPYFDKRTALIEKINERDTSQDALMVMHNTEQCKINYLFNEHTF
jgi:hypothetical protein